jgi:hypothetical protein
MSVLFHEVVRNILPNLTATNYRITSPTSWKYNCIAWAVGSSDAWWWPTPGRFWPNGAPREESLHAFTVAMETQGFSLCSSSELEPGMEKIALYAVDMVPTHAARQLPSGWWTSKLGPDFDIEHADLNAVAGGVYGQPVAFLSRPIAPSADR